MTKYVYDSTERDKSQRDLLGGKGANLAEMTNLGLPVPRVNASNVQLLKVAPRVP